MSSDRLGIIVSARMGSTRLPEKAIKPLQGRQMLDFLFKRLKSSNLVDEFIFATTNKEEDKVLLTIASDNGFKTFAGSTNNLIDRYVRAAREYDVDTVIRVTGDCPFVNGEMIDYCCSFIEGKSYDLASTKSFFPEGIDAEFYKSNVMESLSEEVLSEQDKEHLTLYLYKNKNKYNILNIHPPEGWLSKHSFTIDTPEDYLKAIKIADHFESYSFSIQDMVNLSF